LKCAEYCCARITNDCQYRSKVWKALPPRLGSWPVILNEGRIRAPWIHVVKRYPRLAPDFRGLPHSAGSGRTRTLIMTHHLTE
jgi:hypothetical protein